MQVHTNLGRWPMAGKFEISKDCTGDDRPIRPLLRSRSESLRRHSLSAVLGAVVLLSASLVSSSPSNGARAQDLISQYRQVIAVSSTDSTNTKFIAAYCPINMRVAGGGGLIFESNDGHNVALTQLRPFYYLWNPEKQNVFDAYVVTAKETGSGTTANWRVYAYAICVNHSQGQFIVTKSTSYNSSAAKSIAAGCNGAVVWGSGALVSAGSSGQVVLQVARTSSVGDIVRARAHEAVGGFDGKWALTAFAVCGGRTAGYNIVFSHSTAQLSETTKESHAPCPIGSVLLSAGGALSNTAPGNVSLRAVYPSGPVTFVQAAENSPTANVWDFIVAAAICAT